MGSSQSKGSKSLSPDYNYVRLTWVDLAGRGRGKTVPTHCLNDKGTTACREGMEGIIPDTISKSVLLTPDLSSLHLVPWVSTEMNTVGQVFCEMQNPENHKTMDCCSRALAKMQLRKLETLGFTLMSGFEIEFTITSQKSPVFKAGLGSTYMNQDLFTNYQDMMFNLEKGLRQAGAKVETLHTELCAGQFEVTFEASNGIEAADSFFLAKSAIRTLCMKQGMEAHFDAVMYKGETGNASHYNTSLLNRKKGAKIFWDLKNEDNLSETAKYWMAGILEHMPAITALFAPTSQCYKRYHMPWNPHIANWDIDNRACSLRTKNWDPSQTYVENRLPSGNANPYLVMAGTVAAGIHGLVTKMQCPPKGCLSGNLVPSNLENALSALKADTYMTEALGKGFIERYESYIRRSNAENTLL